MDMESKIMSNSLSKNIIQEIDSDKFTEIKNFWPSFNSAKENLAFCSIPSKFIFASFISSKNELSSI